MQQSRAVCERKLFRIMESVILRPVMVIFLVGQLATIGRGANILYISSVASPSHFLWSQRLFERLAEVGHNVTVVNLYKHGFIRGVHLLKLDGVIADLSSSEEDEEDYVEFGQMNPFEMHVSFAELELQVCESAIKNRGYKSLLAYPRNFRFDLVIHDHLAGPCLLSLLSVFNYPPLVLASAFNRLSTTSWSLGTLSYPGFIPNQAYNVDGPMNLYQRSLNFALSCWEHFFKEFVYYPKLDNLIKEYLNQTDCVSCLEKLALLVVLNSNPLLEPPEPKLASVIQVGGLHIQPTKQLPSDLKEIIDKSSNGFILFSLGTNARSDLLDAKILLEIVTAMRTLSSYTFLWKLDSEDCLPTRLPPNVFTSAWFPQNDLLAHPNARLFITHGGLLSAQEAAWHGVPVVGIPIYADQFGNVNQLIWKGVGVRLSLVDLSSRQLIDCINDVIHNESYKKNSMLLSKLLGDRKESPLDTAIWSIEWVLRNAETSHKWNQSLINYEFLEKYSFDVVIAFVCITLLIFTATLLIVSVPFRLAKNKSKIE